MTSRRKQNIAAVSTKLRIQDHHHSKYHPNRNCSDCALCGHAITTVTHFGAWGTAEKQFVIKHLGKELPPSSCICKAHHTEAKRHCSKDKYTPKWKKVTQPAECILVCSYPQCSATTPDARLIEPSFESPESIKLALNINPDHLVLCPKYYTEVHKKFTSPQCCASCGMKPKKGTQFTRHCPDPEAINLILLENMGSSQKLTDNDKICLDCYKSHIATLNSLGEVLTPNELLESDISTWEHELSQTNTSQLTRATLTTVVYVAKELLPQHALLLPHVSAVFREAYQFSESSEVGEGTIKFTSQWLLNQLVIHLHRYMNYKCIHKKFSTILFRKGGNTLLSLSWAMGRLRLGSRDEAEEALLKQQKLSHCVSNSEQILEDAGCIINDLLHKEVEKISDQKLTDDPSSFNIESIISSTDQQLWKFLQLATSNTQE